LPSRLLKELCEAITLDAMALSTVVEAMAVRSRSGDEKVRPR
jgi:hypothetical protein